MPDAQLRTSSTCESWVVLPISMASAVVSNVGCCSSDSDEHVAVTVVVEKRSLRGIHRCEELRDKGSKPVYVSVKTVMSKMSVIVVRREREVDRRLRRFIDFAHTPVVFAIGVAHEIMRCALYL